MVMVHVLHGWVVINNGLLPLSDQQHPLAGVCVKQEEGKKAFTWQDNS